MICPLCNKNNEKIFGYFGKSDKRAIINCDFCGLAYLEDYRKNRRDIYNDNYSVWGKSSKEIEKFIGESKKILFGHLFLRILKFVKKSEKQKILDIGTGQGYLLEVAEDYDFDCYGIEISKYASERANKKFPNKIFCGNLKDAKYKDCYFDVITLTDVLEHLKNPSEIFKEICRILKPNGIIVLTVPNFDSITRKILQKNWFQYKDEHITYWNKKSINFVLRKNNCAELLCENNYKKLKLSYYANYFKRYKSFIGNFFLFFYNLSPNFFKKSSFLNPVTGELLVVAKKHK